MPSAAVTIAIAVVAISILASLAMFSKRLDVRGKFCYIPGGSAGLGKAVAEEMVRRGAHVVIVARGAQRSAETVAVLKKLATDPNQKVFAVTADLMDNDSSQAALQEAAQAFGGQAPDYTFLCAGASKPQLFVDVTPEDLKWGLDAVYWVSAWTAHAATQMMVKQRRKGMLVFVSSFLGYTSFAGWAGYAPGKYAIRGLADTLRSELQMFDIDVRIYMPAGILSPGYEVEQQTKPDVTKQIEEGDTPVSPEVATNLLIKGIERGNYAITNDLATDIVRVVSSGPVPGNGPLDWVYWVIATAFLCIWRPMTDRTVRNGKPAIVKSLEDRGFFN